MPTVQSSLRSPVVTALAISNSLLLLHIIRPRWFDSLCRQLRRLTLGRRSTVSAEALGSLLGQDYEPPLPQPVADALERSRLCFLATTGQSLEPHLSLMRFTYTTGLDPKEPNSEVLIISTQRKTKKFEILTENENVALLVHDFTTHSDETNEDYAELNNRPRYSITLNGTVRVEQGAQAEAYRRQHLARNAAYSQFIVGDDIAIITVRLNRARVCDVNDRVMHFKRDEGVGKAWAECSHDQSPPPKRPPQK